MNNISVKLFLWGVKKKGYKGETKHYVHLGVKYLCTIYVIIIFLVKMYIFLKL